MSLGILSLPSVLEGSVQSIDILSIADVVQRQTDAD
jgi:hypothetical protein